MVIPKPIKLTKADIARFWAKVDRADPDDCWGWPTQNNHYGQFYDYHGSKYLAHRVAFVIANSDTKLHVCHTCNNPPCCNPAHLYAGTQGDNIQQCYDENRAVDNRGEQCGGAKLTESDIYEIRALRNDGRLLREIADVFGISFSQVGYICRGKCWKHI